ncbi:hypothetical protein ACHAWO_004902 [Cyclotella atomus]|uniref:G-protein coupled receptors family 3 profile domain-containing protein n=1 Tax=Cyclotella atomus TaxID=382360 RepID=A0ABD3P5Z9_9STRA
MTTPWLISMGICICFSALFGRLWRRPRSNGFNRVTLKEKDLIVPAAALFLGNLMTLIHWSAISPLRGEHNVAVINTVEIGCWATLGFINIGALLLILSFKARNDSDVFETNGIGIVLFSLLQLTLIGGPVILLIEDEVTADPYFVTAGLVFLLRVFLLFCIFVPIVKRMEA